MWVLFACACGFPILSVLGIWYFRNRSTHAGKVAITMDGASCRLLEDGSVQIKPRKIRNWVYLIVLSVFTIGIIILVGLSFQNVWDAKSTWLEEIYALCFLIPLGISFAGITVYLALSLGTQTVTFHRHSKIIEIGGRASPREISFSSIAHVTKGFTKKGLLVKGISSKSYGIKVVLKDGERIQIGTVSGYGNNSIASDRASQIINKIMGVIGR